MSSSRLGRPRLPVGAYGDISCTWSEPDNAWKARARYRDPDGVLRSVARFRPTAAQAKRALREALAERHRGTDLGIAAEMTVAELADEWLARIAGSGKATGTVQAYKRAVAANVKPALGALRISECGVARVDAALRAINDRNGYGVAKIARTCLSGMFGLAVRQEAIPANPVRSVERLTGGSTRKARALSPDAETRLTDWLRTSESALALDVPDLVDFMLATGCRIGEALACRDGRNHDGEPLLDLDAGTWEINATIIRIKSEGLAIQEHPKSEAGWRVLALPPYAVDLLRRRRSEARLQPREVQILDADQKRRTESVPVVFPSPGGRRLRDPTNTEGDLRHLLDAVDCDRCVGGYQMDAAGEFVLNGKGRRVRCDAGPYSWVTSHTFRKTVATRMEAAGCTPRQVADQLGHRKVSMTTDVYFGRAVMVAAAAQVLDRA